MATVRHSFAPAHNRAQRCPTPVLARWPQQNRSDRGDSSTSDDAAKALVQRLSADSDLAEQLIGLPIEDRRKLLDSEGYEGVRRAHMANVLPQSSGGELSNEEVASVIGSGVPATLETVAATVSASPTLLSPA